MLHVSDGRIIRFPAINTNYDLSVTSLPTGKKIRVELEALPPSARLSRQDFFYFFRPIKWGSIISFGGAFFFSFFYTFRIDLSKSLAGKRLQELCAYFACEKLLHSVAYNYRLISIWVNRFNYRLVNVLRVEVFVHNGYLFVGPSRTEDCRCLVISPGDEPQSVPNPQTFPKGSTDDTKTPPPIR